MNLPCNIEYPDLDNQDRSSRLHLETPSQSPPIAGLWLVSGRPTGSKECVVADAVDHPSARVRRATAGRAGRLLARTDWEHHAPVKADGWAPSGDAPRRPSQHKNEVN